MVGVCMGIPFGRSEAAELAKARGCTGVMCGHIHTPADKMLGDVHYLNSGDWIESLTAVVEHWDGQYELIEYSNFIKKFPFPEDGSPPEEHAVAAAPILEDEHADFPMI